MEAEYTKSLILLFSFTFICPFFLPIFSRNSHFPLITLIWFFIFNLKIWFVNMATFTYISSNYCISIRRFFSELAILQICFVNINKQFYNTLSKWISLEIGNFVFFLLFFPKKGGIFIESRKDFSNWSSVCYITIQWSFHSKHW